MRKGLLFLVLLGLLAAPVRSQVNTGAGTALNPSGTAGPNPQVANDVIYLSGGTIYARNNITGAIDSSNADLRVVWDALVALYPAGGLFQFKNATGGYPCNTLDQESTGGFSNYYCVGLPATAGSAGQYTQWILQGETAPQTIDQFATVPQTSGTYINLTPTAVGTVSATAKIVTVWFRPDVAKGVGASVYFNNIGFLVPNNTRGCETQVDPQNGLNVSYNNVYATINVTQASIPFPAQTACTAWGASDPGGLINLGTTNSSKQESSFNRAFSQGADVAFDIRTEHTTFVSSYGLDSNHCIDYGVRGSTIFHSSFWESVGCAETARALTLGANMGLGSALSIFAFDMEDACPGASPCFNVFVPVYHGLETNPFNTNGIITFVDILQNTGNQGIANFWDGGGGGSLLPANQQYNFARTPPFDNFTRANSTGIGSAWAGSVGTGTFNIVTNAASPSNSAAAALAFLVGGGQPNSDQFALVTGGTLTTTNQWGVTIRSSPVSAATFNGYGCLSPGASANTLQIYKVTTGVFATLGSSVAYTSASGDQIELDAYGPNLYCYARSSAGAIKAAASVSDSSYTSGFTGIYGFQNAAAAEPSLTNFKGGSFATRTGTDSIYNNPMWATTYNTTTNCLAAGSAVAASAVACGSAASGLFSIPITTPTSAVVTTTALTQNSEITVQQRLDTTTGAGAALGVTCNTTPNTTAPNVTARTATTFTITFAAFTTNPGCYQYTIRN